MDKTSLALIGVSGLFSALVDNTPYVATMIPLLEDIGREVSPGTITTVWRSLALGSCLGGNGTMIDASANALSAGLSGRSGHCIGFVDFTRYGHS